MPRIINLFLVLIVISCQNSKKTGNGENFPNDTLVTRRNYVLILYDGRLYSKEDSIIYRAKFNDSTYCLVTNKVDIFAYPYEKLKTIQKEALGTGNNQNHPFKIIVDTNDVPYTLTAFTKHDTLDVILPIRADNRTDVYQWDIIQGSFNKNDYFSPFKIGTGIDKIKSLINEDISKLDKKNLIICLMHLGELSDETILKKGLNNKTLENYYGNHYILYFENGILKSVEFTYEYPCEIVYSYSKNHRDFIICR